MSKIYYLVTNFQKSPSARGSSSPAPLNLRFWWLDIACFARKFSNELWQKRTFKKIRYDV